MSGAGGGSASKSCGRNAALTLPHGTYVAVVTLRSSNFPMRESCGMSCGATIADTHLPVSLYHRIPARPAHRAI